MFKLNPIYVSLEHAFGLYKKTSSQYQSEQYILLPSYFISRVYYLVNPKVGLMTKTARLIFF